MRLPWIDYCLFLSYLGCFCFVVDFEIGLLDRSWVIAGDLGEFVIILVHGEVKTVVDVADAAHIGADGGDQFGQPGQCLKLGRDCRFWWLILGIFREANDVADVGVALDTFDWQQRWGELVGGGKGFQKGEVLCAGPSIHNCRQHRVFLQQI